MSIANALNVPLSYLIYEEIDMNSRDRKSALYRKKRNTKGGKFKNKYVYSYGVIC